MVMEILQSTAKNNFELQKKLLYAPLA